jgi:hypothetical protein
MIQDVPTGLDSFLPPVLRLFVIIGALALTAFVLYRSKTGRIWKEERDAALAKSERLEKENQAYSVENAALKVRTDITDIRARAIASEDEHKRIVLAIEENTKILRGFMSQMATVFETQVENFRAISEGLREVKRSEKQHEQA